MTQERKKEIKELMTQHKPNTWHKLIGQGTITWQEWQKMCTAWHEMKGKPRTIEDVAKELEGELV